MKNTWRKLEDEQSPLSDQGIDLSKKKHSDSIQTESQIEEL